MSLTIPELEQPAPKPEPPPAPKRAAAPFAHHLAAAPYEFEFYQVMRRLEALHRARPRFGRSTRPADDVLRLGQEPSVTHTPASLAGYEAGADDRSDRLLVHFFGLFGTDGPLPLHLTEYARDRRRNHGDAAFARFVDLFHHRTLSLFFRAWADVRPTVSFDRPEQDRFGQYVASLIGLGMPGLRDRDAMPDLTKLHFSGHLATQTRHAEGLASILSAFFTMPVRVESFVGAWLTLPGSDYTRLGGGTATAGLGQSALLGARVWSRQQKFRLVFGPLSLAEYERLLPGGLSFHRLIPIVRNYAGDVLIWDVNLILQQEEVPPIRLGQQGRLGWTTWLLPRRSSADAADLFLDASADSHASEIDRHAEPEDILP
ncbi:MAG TPA: type VI secretion system baseplate subunit TssG [Acetobacteraceae bacterium]|jgi:type VI secretion system protein ImpH|nr:type VI secretion system baseplate subunit TssG [Acetobacteraceae bacterium]